MAQYGWMRKPRTRPNIQPPLEELRLLRCKKFPQMPQADFAVTSGITRLHLIAIEQGRRIPSRGLALRWIAALGPEAKLGMFGDVVLQERAGKFTKKAIHATAKAA